MLINGTIGVFAALDARELGMTKMFCVLWFIMILVFPLSVLMYLILRYTRVSAIRRQLDELNKQAAEKTRDATCPYCSAPCSRFDKICSSCGRLL